MTTLILMAAVYGVLMVAANEMARQRLRAGARQELRATRTIRGQRRYWYTNPSPALVARGAKVRYRIGRRVK